MTLESDPESRLPIIDYAVEYGQQLGCNYIEARYIEARDEGYTLRNGLLLGGGITSTRGVGVRILHRGNIAFTSTATITKESIQEIVQMAKSMSQSMTRSEPIQFSEEKSVETRWSTPCEIPFQDIPVEQKQEYFREIDQALAKKYGESLPNRTFMINLNEEFKYICNSDGSKVISEKSQPIIHTFNTAVGKYGTEQRFYGKGGVGGWEWFDKQNVRDTLLRDADALVKTAKFAENMTLGTIDVIVNSEVAGIMAHENVGHPSEGDRIWGREGAQAGESFYSDLLKDGKLGEVQLGNPKVTILEDPTMPGSSGFYLYDDECVKARPRALIKEGKLNELLLNREFAHKFGVTSNASARASKYNREPIVRMANTYFKPGSYSLEELVEDVKSGMLMNSFTEWNIDDRRYQSKYVGLECYVIENGEITEKMIRRPILELTTRGILGSVDGVSKQFGASHGTCGKCDPSQGVPVWMGGGEVRMRNIRLGGV
ncbi:MAG: TldD/PmbA family protein [Promethearchaeota archaeon]